MQKHFSGGLKEWFFLLAAAAVLIAILLFPLRFALANGLTQDEQKLLHAIQTGEIIRIHIIANSDSETDQALKFKVRDAIIDAFGHLLSEAGTQSHNAVWNLLVESTDQMARTAQSCACQNGFTGRVETETGYLALPEKQYGNVVLPAGYYHALRITLGDGNGQNWWCVLYPQLCLSLSQSFQPIEHQLAACARQMARNWFLVSK